MTTAFVGFGSNVGDRVDSCNRVVTLLRLLPGTQVVAVSSLYETEPVAAPGDPGPGWFLNGVMQIETDVKPHKLLEVFREIERALGRDEEDRHGPRTMDLDLLFYGDQLSTDPGMLLPHPRLHRRRFVLTPLAEIAPTWTHPVLKQTVEELLATLDDPATVRRFLPFAGTAPGGLPPCHTPPEGTPSSTDNPS